MWRMPISGMFTCAIVYSHVLTTNLFVRCFHMINNLNSSAMLWLRHIKISQVRIFLFLGRYEILTVFLSSGLLPEMVPPILSTIASPLQYGYRTKITPHFDSPSKKLVKEQTGPPTEKPPWLNIGFNREGTRKVMDIEVVPFI